MPAKKERKAKVARLALLFTRFGYSLIGLAALLVVVTYLPIISLELRYVFTRPNTNSPGSQTVAPITPVDNMLGLVIPKIGANAKIIPNVDPYNSREYQIALTKGVAHAKGTVLPGNVGNSFIFSHSSVNFLEASRYNSIFYLLHNLETGDEIEAYVEGQKFVYRVTGKQMVAAGDVSFITKKTTESTLTLMTCWPPGTTFKRLIITATLTP